MLYGEVGTNNYALSKHPPSEGWVEIEQMPGQYDVVQEDGSLIETEIPPEPEPQQPSELDQAKYYVASEMKVADIMINYHADGDDRATQSIEQWRDYRKALRDYVKGGVVNTTKPPRPGEI